MGTWTGSQWPQDLHLPAQLGGLDPITPMTPTMLLSCETEIHSLSVRCKNWTVT
jgi:hypothetical protein